jgi:hypothetical protein
VSTALENAFSAYSRRRRDCRERSQGWRQEGCQAEEYGAAALAPGQVGCQAGDHDYHSCDRRTKPQAWLAGENHRTIIHQVAAPATEVEPRVFEPDIAYTLPALPGIGVQAALAGVVCLGDLSHEERC